MARRFGLPISLALTAVGMVWTTVPSAATAVSVPLSCNRGPSGQHADLVITIPESVESGSTFAVRIDGKNSGTISHTGLRYIHDMMTDVLIPAGTKYVEGSARIIPDTGTPNVRPGASATKQGGGIRLELPAHVPDGSNYTPPSFEFQLKVVAAAGSKIEQRFWQYRVTANAIIIGDVVTVCDPTPKPYRIGVTSVTPSNGSP